MDYANVSLNRIYALGSAVLFATSFPFMMRRGIATWGFIPGVVLIAIGLGGVQASLQPFIGKAQVLIERNGGGN